MAILKEIYFVRHGQTDSNVDGIYRGADSMLTAEGKSQAEAVASRAMHLNADALVASNFPRARDTAAAIEEKTGLTAEVSELFGEWREASVMYGKHRESPEVVAILRAVSQSDSHEFKHSDDESFAELQERGGAALAFLAGHTAKRIVVVTHSAFLRVLFGCITLEDLFTRKHFSQFVHHLPVTNTGVGYARLTDDKGWQFVTWNDDAHLG